MKKIIIALCMVFVLMVSVGIAVVSAKNQKQDKEFSLPDNAVEVAPGVFYLGESQDVDGTPVKGYAFIHYTKDYLETSTESITYPDGCYNFVFGSPRIWASVEPYVINPTNDFGLDEDVILTTFETSVSTWENAKEIEEYDIIGEGSLTTEKINKRRLDGINLVRFRTLQRGVIAMNIIWSDGTNLIEWDQMYSNKFDWSLSGEAGKMDFQNIATHELGHAVGLGDLYNHECNTQTMYGYSDYGETDKQILGTGDINGIQALYG